MYGEYSVEELRTDKNGRPYLFVKNGATIWDPTQGHWTSLTILPNPVVGLTVFYWYSKDVLFGMSQEGELVYKTRRWVKRTVILNGSGVETGKLGIVLSDMVVVLAGNHGLKWNKKDTRSPDRIAQEQADLARWQVQKAAQSSLYTYITSDDEPF